MSIEHPLLRAAGAEHGFGERGDAPRAEVLRPVQVHGARAVRAEQCAGAAAEADAVVAVAGSRAPVGVITADCVPVLAAVEGAAAVAAIHAGWRGLAAGVVEAGLAALRREAPDEAIVAVVGPRIGACCYEVDAPVVEALRARELAGWDAALRPGRLGHWWLDLGAATRAALLAAGAAEVAVLEEVCTRCDARRFHSHRRDGAGAGRLLHWIAPAGISQNGR